MLTSSNAYSHIIRKKRYFYSYCKKCSNIITNEYRWNKMGVVKRTEPQMVYNKDKIKTPEYI